MNNTAPNTVANSTLPFLVTLVLARKQARWQWANCANAYKHRWVQVIEHLDERIRKGEKSVADRMDLPAFRIKREVVE